MAFKQRHRTTRKKLRSGAEAPIRILDHIRDWFFYKDTELTQSEANLVMLYKRLENWGDTSVYFNDKGEILPEVLHAMIAIRTYDVGSDRSSKQWFDL